MVAPSPTDVLTVAQVTGIIKNRLESDTRLNSCRVTGEISNFKHHSSGHMYFTLKDDTSRLRALMFATRNRSLSFLPKDGLRVICRGSIGVFDRDGQYQLYVDEMQPDGVGALYAAFVQLRDRLDAEGLFARDRKRPLPRFPQTIGVVTSPTGAVIRDICTTLARRFPLAKVVLAPALVQGPDAAKTIVAAMQRLTQGATPQVDVLIVGRGGGSLEELWPFNDEALARAIADCPVPVVSAVGHETDFTICDFVADVRAATPTAAAELVAPNAAELQELLKHQELRATQALYHRIEHLGQRLQRCEHSVILSDPFRLVDRLRERLDYQEQQMRDRVRAPLHVAARRVASWTERLLRYPLQERITRQMSHVDLLHLRGAQQMRAILARKTTSLESTHAALTALNPMAVLARGYSMVTRPLDGEVVTSMAQIAPGMDVHVRLSDGEFAAKVQGEGADCGYGVQYKLDI